MLYQVFGVAEDHDRVETVSTAFGAGVLAVIDVQLQDWQALNLLRRFECSTGSGGLVSLGKASRGLL
jgi:hypothetical protein